MPNNLMSDIRNGSIEMEDQDIDLEELDQAYEQDLDKQEFKQDDSAQQQQQQPQQQPPGAPGAIPPPAPM
jgi:hypothetical protein